MGRLVLTFEGLLWFQSRYPWIFRDDSDRIEDAAPGDIVTLERKAGTFLAEGFYRRPEGMPPPGRGFLAPAGETRSEC